LAQNRSEPSVVETSSSRPRSPEKSMDWWNSLDWWSLTPYWVPAAIAVVAIVVLASAARSRAAKRSSLHRRAAASSSVDAFYLDSSHMGEPETHDRQGDYVPFNPRAAARHKRHASRSRAAH
jgi:hypothetical protein